MNSYNNIKNDINYYKTKEEIKEAKNNLYKEPEENDENGTEIILRHPKTGKRSLSNQLLYNNIVSNEDIIQEINYQYFNMNQPFPRKVLNDFEETFEEAF